MNSKEKVVIFFSWLMLGGIVVLAIVSLTKITVLKNQGSATMYSDKLPVEDRFATAQKKLAADPDDFQAIMFIVDTYLENGHSDEAIDFLNRAEKLQPMSVHVQSDFGVVYQRKGQYDLALERYQAALKIDPEDINSLYHIGIIYRDDKNDAQSAMEIFEKILLKNPEPQISQMVINEIQKIKASKTAN